MSMEAAGFLFMGVALVLVIALNVALDNELRRLNERRKAAKQAGDSPSA
jgi:hypothetical protein